MARLRALLVAAILLAGCRGSYPPGPIDPFFGRTRVEPPYTGAATGQPALDPYSPAPPQITLPPAMAPLPGSSSASEPGPALAFTEQPGDHITIPSAARDLSAAVGEVASLAPARPARPEVVPEVASTDPVGVSVPSAARVAGAQRSQVAPSGRQRIYQTIGPRPQQADGLASSSQPRFSRTAVVTSPSAPRPSPSSRVINITDLPPPPVAGEVDRADHGIQLVSGIEELDDSPAWSSPTATGGSTLPSSSSLYGFDPQYRWLRGRLEYSQIDRHWRLRYIPIDGVTDKFGGSVILTPTDLLSGYERGDFVEVHGKLGQVQPDNRSFSPNFEVQKIELLRR